MGGGDSRSGEESEVLVGDL
ncbi:hypothetical protein LINPERPRIM_LOCUS10329 [Linum perenne]